MPETRELVLFHIPQSRSITVLWLLEELGRPYRRPPASRHPQ